MSGKCIHDLFAEQAARTPEAVAAVYEDERLTYGELNRRANQLAHYLRSLWVGAEVVVGLHVRRSLEMIVGVLGISKAGGACLPLDPEHPPERLRFMLSHAAAPLLLTELALIDTFPRHREIRVCLDAAQISYGLFPDTPPQVVSDPEQLGCVMYTPSAIGTLKALGIPHRVLVDFIGWRWPDLAGSNAASVPQLDSLSLDASIQEIFTTLATGQRFFQMDDSCSAPIGKPIANAEIHVLDSYLDPVSRGDCGELYIGGAVLARGYLNEPARTAERFIASPYAQRGGRLYRTGNLVRYRPDGNMEFIGRVDDEVKPGEQASQHADKPQLYPTFVEARTADERTIAEICEQVLRIEAVGVNDNLLELGANSVMAAQVLAKIKERFATPLTLHDVFARPTVAAIAEILKGEAVIELYDP